MTYRYERTQRTVLAICETCGRRELAADVDEASRWARAHEDRCNPTPTEDRAALLHAARSRSYRRRDTPS